MENPSQPTSTPLSETPSELKWSKELLDKQFSQLRQLHREGCLTPKEGSEVDLSRLLNPPKDDPPKE